MDIKNQKEYKKDSYTHKFCNVDMSEFVNHSAYVVDWKEKVNLETDNVFIFLEFHDELSADERTYQQVAREIANFDISATVVAELYNGVYIEPIYHKDALDFYKENVG